MTGRYHWTQANGRAPHPDAELVIGPATSGRTRWRSILSPHAGRGLFFVMAGLQNCVAELRLCRHRDHARQSRAH